MCERFADLARTLPYFRGRAAVLQRLTRHHRFINATVFGLPMVLDLSELIQRYMFQGCFEPDETKAIRRLLKRDGVFVDGGANAGWFTALAASIVGPNGTVVAFEPSPQAYRILRDAVAGCAHVQAFNFGLSDRERELNLFVPPPESGNHNPSIVDYQADSTAVTIRVKPLGAVLEALGIRQVDVLKLDVEGHEPEVLAGCESFLKSGSIRSILCEFNDPLLRMSGSSSADLLSYLVELGYEVDGTLNSRAVPGHNVNLLLHFSPDRVPARIASGR
jgi:FkbM family methyltransferase